MLFHSPAWDIDWLQVHNDRQRGRICINYGAHGVHLFWPKHNVAKLVVLAVGN